MKLFRKQRDILYPHKGFNNAGAGRVVDELENCFTAMHLALGINLNDPNSKETPRRAAKAFAHELFGGLNRDSLPKITVFPNDRGVDSIVLVGIDYFHSMCAHHWASFTGRAWIGYIPGKTVLGLSKFARIFDFFAARPQIQENLTEDVADYLERMLEPKALGVVVEASHNCMCARGVKKHGKTSTSALRGIFLKKAEARKELYDLIQQSKS